MSMSHPLGNINYAQLVEDHARYLRSLSNEERAALRPRGNTPNTNNNNNNTRNVHSNSSTTTTPGGASWNYLLNMNQINGSVHRKMPLTLVNGRNKGVNSIVTPYDMYVALLYPSCPVGIDTKTRKKLRDYATRMTKREPLLKTQRERMEALLKRLVAGGSKCGLPPKNHGKKYRLPTKKEMTNIGFTTVGESGKFFYKRPRKANPQRNPKKSHGHPHQTRLVAISPTRPVHTPTKRAKLKTISTYLSRDMSHTSDVNINRAYTLAFQKRELLKLIRRYAGGDMFFQPTDAQVPEFYFKALRNDFSFLHLLSLPSLSN